MKLLVIINLSFVLVFVIGSLIYYKQQTDMIEQLFMLQHFEHNINYQFSQQTKRTNTKISDTLVEFQKWRLHLTVASRSGYAAADRYLRQYPLKLTYLAEDY